jgi:hypothetical protein
MASNNNGAYKVSYIDLFKFWQLDSLNFGNASCYDLALAITSKYEYWELRYQESNETYFKTLVEELRNNVKIVEKFVNLIDSFTNENFLYHFLKRSEKTFDWGLKAQPLTKINIKILAENFVTSLHFAVTNLYGVKRNPIEVEPHFVTYRGRSSATLVSFASNIKDIWLSADEKFVDSFELALDKATETRKSEYNKKKSVSSNSNNNKPQKDNTQKPKYFKSTKPGENYWNQKKSPVSNTNTNKEQKINNKPEPNKKPKKLKVNKEKPNNNKNNKQTEEEESESKPEEGWTEVKNKKLFVELTVGGKTQIFKVKPLKNGNYKPVKGFTPIVKY